MNSKTKRIEMRCEHKFLCANGLMLVYCNWNLFRILKSSKCVYTRLHRTRDRLGGIERTESKTIEMKSKFKWRQLIRRWLNSRKTNTRIDRRQRSCRRILNSCERCENTAFYLVWWRAINRRHMFYHRNTDCRPCVFVYFSFAFQDRRLCDYF